MTPSILDDVMFCADAVPAIVSTRARMTPIEREIMEVSLLFSLALGPHPQRDLSLTPRLGFTRPRLGVAAGAFSLALGPPQRPIADASPQIYTSSARCGRRRFFTGAGESTPSA